MFCGFKSKTMWPEIELYQLIFNTTLFRLEKKSGIKSISNQRGLSNEANY